jgi:hypothetical protein
MPLWSLPQASILYYSNTILIHDLREWLNGLIVGIVYRSCLR